MNGVALLLAAASLAVDYSWEKSSAGQIEYMVRVEAEVIPSLVSGEEIHSDVPAEAGTVDRFRLRVGVDGNQPVFTPAAPGRFGVAPDRSAMLVKSGGAATETQEVSFGWQPNTDGKLMYYVQISPELLRTLEVGDEIQAAVDTSAGSVATFVVFGGNKQLPRIPTGSTGAAATAGTQPPSRFSPDGNTSPAGGQFNDSRFGGATPTAATEPTTGSRFGGNSTDSAASPATGGTPGSRFGDRPATDTSGSQPGSFRFGQGASSPSTTGSGTDAGPGRFGDSRPGGFNPPPIDNSSTGSTGFSNSDAGRNPGTASGSFSRPPAGSGGTFPSNDQPTGFRNPPAQEQPGRAYDNRPSIEPPPATSANRPPANSPQPQPPNPPANSTTQNYAPAGPNPNDRMAMVDPNTARGAAGFNTQPTAAPPTAVAEAEKPWWWGWLVFFFCVMCLSIGGNLYLGWTAVEFYHRYQRAVERLRSGTTARA